ncbi:peptide chain release factor N(5)-glutamine methyltransferase [Lysobacter sp. H21R4]|uniref:peptide chain release factor N(5)-glutamine methyltransferase n=1 Tax=Lysobacter sp. H21R4 TaxID=2781021 RepID=UPI001886E4BE|nr:peptide chain release factor N(5)-glutamine methyltransferase [Lysobacter sp. H21R4]QOY62300.1 peptide chain release factor N(5)-glutamine methyltransferase [Lysobacter sp. H21R4]
MARIDSILREARAGTGAGEAELLLAHALGRSRTWLYAHGDEELDDAVAERFGALLERRRAGEPVAYLTGQRGFWRFDLQVSPATLIPRAETELLVEQTLARLPADRKLRVADLGTGSGAVALAVAMERPSVHVIATDASESALAVAAGNARALGLGNVQFCHGDWLQPLAGMRFDLIVSNPPYIAEDDAHLGQGDLRFEPRSALAAGADGLDDIRTIIGDAPALLASGGWLLLEHGLDQGNAVRALMREAGLGELETVLDLEQRDRVSLGRAR